MLPSGKWLSFLKNALTGIEIANAMDLAYRVIHWLITHKR
jgi:hypothetical protein